MSKHSVEYQGCIYRLRYESSRPNQKEGLGRDAISAGSVFLDAYTYLERALPSDKPCMKIIKSLSVLENCVIGGYSIDTVETVGDHSCRSLYIVLELVKNQQLLKIFRFDTQSCHILECKQVAISKSLFNHDQYPVFLSGPTVLWLARHKYVCIISCIGDASEQVLKIEKRTLNLLFAVTLLSCFSDHQWILIATRTIDDILFRKFCLNLCDGSVSSVKNLPSTIFFSDEYKNLVTTISIKFSNKVQSSLICNNQKCFENIDILKQNSTCVCTKGKQFIVFVAGVIKYCCTIPFHDVTAISELRQYQPPNISFLLKSASGTALLQKNKTNFKIQVTEVWKKFLLSFFGDFQRKGKKVLIFLPGEDSFPIINFILNEIIPPGVSEKKAVHPGLNENSPLMNTLIQDLNKRVLFGQAALTSLEETLQDKHRVLDSAILTLQNTRRSGKLDSKYQHLSLVDVALGFQPSVSTNIGTSHQPEAIVEPEYALECLARWQTSLKENWIVGQMFRNVSESTIQNLTCTLLSCEQILESQQLVFLHLESENQAEPLLQDSLNLVSHIPPGKIVSLVSAVKIPFIFKDCLQVPIVLAWQVAGKDTIRQQTSEQVKLQVASLIDQRDLHFEELSHVQQLLSFRVLQTPVSLVVVSQVSKVESLEETLKAKGIEDPIPLHHQAGTTFLFRSQASPLWGVNFTYTVQERTQAQVFLYCSTPNQLLLFVHWLYPSLNPDALVLPGHSFNTAPSCKRLWKSMGKELEFVVKTLGNFSKEKSKKTFSSMREQCSHDRKQLEKKTEQWTLEEYSQFRNDLHHREKVTDEYFRDLL